MEGGGGDWNGAGPIKQTLRRNNYMSVTNITEHLLLNPRSHCLIITIVLFDLVWCFDLVFQFKIQDYFIISFKK